MEKSNPPAQPSVHLEETQWRQIAIFQKLALEELDKVDRRDFQEFKALRLPPPLLELIFRLHFALVKPKDANKTPSEWLETENWSWIKRIVHHYDYPQKVKEFIVGFPETSTLSYTEYDEILNWIRHSEHTDLFNSERANNISRAARLFVKINDCMLSILGIYFSV